MSRIIGGQMGNGRVTLAELKETQYEIQEWYRQESEHIKCQAKIDEINSNETVRLYHHSLHQKHIKKSVSPI